MTQAEWDAEPDPLRLVLRAATAGRSGQWRVRQLAAGLIRRVAWAWEHEWGYFNRQSGDTHWAVICDRLDQPLRANKPARPWLKFDDLPWGPAGPFMTAATLDGPTAATLDDIPHMGLVTAVAALHASRTPQCLRHLLRWAGDRLADPLGQTPGAGRAWPGAFPSLVRDVYPTGRGGPFFPAPVPAAVRTPTVLALARHMWQARDFSAMPILADALQDAGCERDDVLLHCRNPEQSHCRGCWVLDAILT